MGDLLSQGPQRLAGTRMGYWSCTWVPSRVPSTDRWSDEYKVPGLDQPEAGLGILRKSLSRGLRHQIDSLVGILKARWMVPSPGRQTGEYKIPGQGPR